MEARPLKSNRTWKFSSKYIDEKLIPVDDNEEWVKLKKGTKVFIDEVSYNKNELHGFTIFNNKAYELYFDPKSLKILF